MNNHFFTRNWIEIQYFWFNLDNSSIHVWQSDFEQYSVPLVNDHSNKLKLWMCYRRFKIKLWLHYMSAKSKGNDVTQLRSKILTWATDLSIMPNLGALRCQETTLTIYCVHVIFHNVKIQCSHSFYLDNQRYRQRKRNNG